MSVKWLDSCRPLKTDVNINILFSRFFSRAILGYLVNKYGKDDRIYPKDPQKRALVDRMLYFDIGTLYKSMVDYFVSRPNNTLFFLYLSLQFVSCLTTTAQSY